MSLTVLGMIALVCAFEFINGFHDTANAVATVIYTKTLPPQFAVIYSGILNFFGVFLGGLGVAFSIVELMPVLSITSYGETISLVVVAAILVTSIIRNILTWYKGLPASSSHTLIGSIFGAFLGFALLHPATWSLLPTSHLVMVIVGLLLSPLVGFGLTYLLVHIIKKLPLIEHWFHSVHHKHSKQDKPPMHVRATLIITCGLVSFFHGSNDGQKGIGLIVVILVLAMPEMYGSMMTTHIVPLWVMLIVPFFLGLGTTIGRKRIVKTLGKKIGQHPLTYLQGASAELVAASTLALSSAFHLPISTTHVLSSGIAGSMLAQGGLKNIRFDTIKNILYAWLFTLPFCITVSGVLVYGIGLWIG